MRNSTRTKAIVAVLVAGALTPVAPAVARYDDSLAGATAASGTDDSSSIVLRRDPNKAIPFVADVSPGATTVASDGFDWGSAAIGAGAGMLTVGLAALGTGAIRDRREHAHQGVPGTTQSA